MDYGVLDGAHRCFNQQYHDQFQLDSNRQDLRFPIPLHSRSSQFYFHPSEAHTLSPPKQPLWLSMETTRALEREGTLSSTASSVSTDLSVYESLPFSTHQHDLTAIRSSVHMPLLPFEEQHYAVSNHPHLQPRALQNSKGLSSMRLIPESICPFKDLPKLDSSCQGIACPPDGRRVDDIPPNQWQCLQECGPSVQPSITNITSAFLSSPAGSPRSRNKNRRRRRRNRVKRNSVGLGTLPYDIPPTSAPNMEPDGSERYYALMERDVFPERYVKHFGQF